MSRRKTYKSQKAPFQFSKAHVIFADAMVFYALTASALLSFLGKEPISDVSVAIITIFGAFVTGGYFTQNCIRDCSYNDVQKAQLRKGVRYDGDEGETMP